MPTVLNTYEFDYSSTIGPLDVNLNLDFFAIQSGCAASMSINIQEPGATAC